MYRKYIYEIKFLGLNTLKKILNINEKSKLACLPNQDFPFTAPISSRIVLMQQ